MSHTYQAWVQRENRWWMIRIPEIDGITQARNKAEVELMAKDLVAISLDIPVDSVSVELLRGAPE
jgi:hypothetical protein